MDSTVTHRSLIAIAKKEIRAMKCPAGMRSDIWRQQREFLLLLAGYLPSIWPSQRVLAQKLGCSQPAIHRRVSTARHWGLIATSDRPNDGWADGLEYRLVCLSEFTKAAISRYGSSYGSVPKVSPPSPKEDRSLVPPGLVPAGGCAASAYAASMARWEPDDQDPIIGDDQSAPLRSTTVSLPPGERLAGLFRDEWRSVARRDKSLPPRLGYVIALRYIKGAMLKEVDPGVAEAFILAFCRAARDGEIEFKDGQLPIERFTGWWGRQQIEDVETHEADQATISEALRQHRERVAREGLTGS